MMLQITIMKASVCTIKLQNCDSRSSFVIHFHAANNVSYRSPSNWGMVFPISKIRWDEVFPQSPI